MSPTVSPRDWEERYQQGDKPWDSSKVSAELIRVLDEDPIEPCRALEIGCGTGINAAYLAQRLFMMTAIDASATALAAARERAEAANVQVEFIEGDVTNPPLELSGPFDFVFDRGCYHVVRRWNLPGLLKMLQQVTRPGSRMLVLCGNANEQSDEGPPRLHEHEIRADLETLFHVERLREFRFHDEHGSGPLAWSCLLVRREGT